MSPDINDPIGYDDSGGTVDIGDVNAPEAGSFPPPVYPGVYDFLFKLEDEPFDYVDTPSGPKLRVRFRAAVLGADGGAILNPATERPYENPDGLELRFQQASFYKPAAMPISFGADLLRSLGVRLEGTHTEQSIKDIFASLDGRARFKAEVIWRAYFDDTDTTISTRPRRSKGELEWPRGADGLPELLVADPKTGEKRFGRAEISRFKLPAQ